jgi:ABC-2 type transport system ATP-binding protein
VDRIVEIEGLSKRFKNQRGIFNVNMTVHRGDIYGYFGPNGAGKTTVMKIMAGLSRADKGTAKMFGYNAATHFEQAMAKVGVLIETAEAYNYMSARKNLEMAARLYPDVDRKRVDEVLELVGLSSFHNEKVGQYSLGMKQRLGIAAAILSKPELLILDDPTNGLDIEGMGQSREIILQLAKEESITFLISSHLIHEMELMCNRIGIIYNGRLIREGLQAELLEEGRFATLEELFIHEIKAERKTAVHA